MAQSKPIAQGIVITERKQTERALSREKNFSDAVMNSLPGLLFVFDDKGNTMQWNRNVEKVTGYSATEISKMNILHFVANEDQKIAVEAMQEVLTKGQASLEINVLSKPGKKIPFYITGLHTKIENASCVVCTGIDITERKQAEDALRRSEERYRTIIENIQDGYHELDLVGNFTFVNDVTCMHLGYTKEELIGMNYRSVQDETTAKKAYQIHQEVYRTGEQIKALESEYIRKDGTKEIYESSVSLIRDAHGKPIGFRGISRNVTERKKAEEQLKRYAAELERSNEEVKNFAYIVSHDLRVPLVNLKGYTAELRSALEVIGSNFDAALPHLIEEKQSAVATALHEDVPEALEFITSSVSRMDSFINAILILSRLGRQDLKPEPIDMNALVQTTVETMSHQLQERGIEVNVGSLPHVVADRIAMEQIMGNILGNAVKYLDSSRPGRIEVTAQANGAETTFRIRDNGRGIAAEDMHKVFTPFRRAGKQDTPGEGMGLAYVQTLLRRHGGRISCESELGKGTTFTFTISTRSEKGACDA